ncbi:MAG: hypothetical protein DI586_08185 [Micavibrio aeruginosavorus]|uniref:Uncharacterized protein n=1 Tax=Micavibrio aeruginosavorus TaxID=349221 RepID=A0A2W5FG70_9BACT|nr:MAG: hypothetical protein DI586_08185 [Micavibrio aeruginosavorus]
MTRLTGKFQDTDQKAGLYQTLLRNRLGSVFTGDDIEDIFIKLKNRAPELLEDNAVTKDVDISKVVQCIGIEDGITWREAKALCLRDPVRLLNVAAHHATHPQIYVVKGLKPL